MENFHENYHIVTSLYSSSFPNYQGILPKALPSEASLDRLRVRDAVKRVLIASDKSKAIELCLEGGSLTLNARTLEGCVSRETVPCHAFSGDACTLVVNGRFLLDVLSNVQTEELHFQYKDNNRAFFLEPSQLVNDCHSKHVIVPLMEKVN